MKKVGLIVNPIAGMGGSVGLKGTDGDTYKQALKMGALPVAPSRMGQFFSNLKGNEELYFLVAPGKMGEDYIKMHEYRYEVVDKIGIETTSKDTIRIAKTLLENNIDLLVFCGGDGTAKDIYDTIDLKIPVVAIPSGVKMYSSVFALNPIAAAKLVDAFLSGYVDFEEREILDINEELYRRDRLASKLFGYLKVLKIMDLIQSSKDGSRFGSSIEQNKLEIAQFIIEFLESKTLYLLGPGTTVKAITDQLKQPKTLLGIDALYNNEIIEKDLNEQRILTLMDNYENVKIILSPIGGQGFILGRGNAQLTPKILRLIGAKNIIVIATKMKMNRINYLRIDTCNVELDNNFKGFIKVITGYKEELISELVG